MADVNAMGPLISDPSLNRGTKLGHLYRARGGLYQTSGHGSSLFHVYTRASFSSVKANRGEITVGILVDTPPSGAARDSNPRKRFEYWQHSKLLGGGSLVVLVVVKKAVPRLFLGVVSSFSDTPQSSRYNSTKICVQIASFDAEIELMGLQRQKLTSESSYAFLVDNNIMYEASRPFLERLQTVKPHHIPFSRYLLSDGSLLDVEVPPPKYATKPGFRFRLDCLEHDCSTHAIRPLNVMKPAADITARRELCQSSTLDSSQVDAVVSSLTREISLIQG